MNTKKGSLTLTVSNISGSGVGYNGSANVETSVTVGKP
jgi:hypothetical protein